MLPVSQAIMELFRDYRIGRNQNDTVPALMGRVEKWDRGLRDQFEKGRRELEDMGFLRWDNDGFAVWLLDAGYDYLYP